MFSKVATVKLFFTLSQSADIPAQLCCTTDSFTSTMFTSQMVVVLLFPCVSMTLLALCDLIGCLQAISGTGRII